MSTSPAPQLARQEDLPQIQRELAAADVVVVDTEFHAEKRYTPRLYLLQIHVPGQRVWIIDALLPDLMRDVGEALVRVPAWLVHAGQQDLRLLKRAFGRVPKTVYDTQVAAGFLGDRYPASLADLLRRHLNYKIDKTATLSDWSQRPLTEEQLAYAAEDVIVLPTLWESLSKQVAALGRTELVLHACQEVAQQALQPPPDDELWRRSALAPALSPSDAAVFRALVSWREKRARESDRPTHFVASDSALRHIARSRPTRIQDLTSHRRLPKPLVKHHADTILHIVRTASALPSDEHPRHIRRDTADARMLEWLRLLVVTQGAQERLAPRLLLPHDKCETIVLTRPKTPLEIEAIIGTWRTDLIGALLLAAVDGGVAIRLESGDVTTVHT